jgi:hypothetical protein
MMGPGIHLTPPAIQVANGFCGEGQFLLAKLVCSRPAPAPNSVPQSEESLMTLRKLLLPGLVLGLVLAGQALAPTAAQEAKKEPKAPPWELAKAKVEAARKACQAVALEYVAGKASMEQCHQWSRRWADAQREVSSKRTNLLEALEAHVMRMEELEKAARDKFDKQRAQVSEVYAAEYHRIEAELALSRAKNSR